MMTWALTSGLSFVEYPSYVTPRRCAGRIHRSIVELLDNRLNAPEFRKNGILPDGFLFFGSSQICSQPTPA